jgi:hypothetical protein
VSDANVKRISASNISMQQSSQTKGEINWFSCDSCILMTIVILLEYTGYSKIWLSYVIC